MSAVLLPFLDWPVDIWEDGDGQILVECQRKRPDIASGRVITCMADMERPASAAELLQSIRRHAAGMAHVGVTWHLQTWTDPHGERHWVDDVREPSPEEIAIAATTADGSFWRLGGGAAVAEITGDELGQRYRIVAEVKP